MQRVSWQDCVQSELLVLVVNVGQSFTLVLPNLPEDLLIHTNAPQAETDVFSRQTFRAVAHDESHHQEFVIHNLVAGSFQARAHGVTGPPMRWIVLPTQFPILSCKTVIARCMGPVDRWRSVLADISAQGYNAFHLTPVHPLGSSGSAYCLLDQLAIRSEYGLESWDQLRQFLSDVRSQIHLYAFTDVVWNHTSTESPWLLEQFRDATYNTVNCPHLAPAAHLDAALQVLGAKWSAHSRVDSAEQVDTLMSHVETHFWAELKINSFFDDEGAVLADKYAIVNNLRKRLMYRIETENWESPLFEPYFTWIDGVACAHNGWVWGSGADDFASASSQVYWRRELIVWSDLVKLRYGDSPEDSPWLWEYMRRYTEQLATVFDGLRIDNCHSTPLHVAQYLCDCARSVNHQCYFMAELFSGDERIDANYTLECGIYSIIHEGSDADTMKQLSHLIYRYCSAPPVGHLNDNSSTLKPSLPPAMFLDCSHDNPTLNEKGRPSDALALACLICCGPDADIGSVWGFDELVPHQVNVVTERGEYPAQMGDRGIGAARHRFHCMRLKLHEQGFSELHVHEEREMLILQRANPDTHECFYFVATSSKYIRGSVASTLPHAIIEYQWGYSLCVDSAGAAELPALVPMQSHLESLEMENFHTMPASSVLCYRGKMSSAQVAASQGLSIENLGDQVKTLLSSATLLDLNFLLYRCEREEMDTFDPSRGAYDVPNWGKLVYCGVSSAAQALRDTDVSSSLSDHLRSGLWLVEYFARRLLSGADSFPLHKLGSWTEDVVLPAIASLPHFLWPKYIARFLVLVDDVAKSHAVWLMHKNVQNMSSFGQRLAMGSVQMYAEVKGAKIPYTFGGIPWKGHHATLAAGLPHFSTGFMRCWGRDTFIAFRGLFLIPGRLDAARNMIRLFAGCVWKGLVPNLVDSGVNPRYNARDATWWFLQSIQDLCTMFPEEGLAMLREPILRLSTKDQRKMHHEPLVEILIEIFQEHAGGILFRETGADADMLDEGFQVSIQLDAKTGFLFGGNDFNCGTWMDKMGSSSRAGNKGVPATPRNGAPIELVALLYSALKWVDSLQQSYPNMFKHAGVFTRLAGRNFLSFKDWRQLIEKSFESHFYIPRNASDDFKHVINAGLVNRRGIYKDVVGCMPREYCDYQLRPNQCIAMVVAPDLFDRAHAQAALDVVQRCLLGPLGMKTLDPSDLQYRPNYDSNADTDDFATSKGFNYHQGPEWLWPVGYFLRARMMYFDDVKAEAKAAINLLQTHRVHLETSEYQGLPELTNESGSPCADSCPTQAWSMSCILEALFDAERNL